MTLHTASKITSLTLGAALSFTWMGSVMLGMQYASTPAPRTIELPTVFVVGHKSTAGDSTTVTTTLEAARKV